jgi:hypothetical protein
LGEGRQSGEQQDRRSLDRQSNHGLLPPLRRWSKAALAPGDVHIARSPIIVLIRTDTCKLRDPRSSRVDGEPTS